MLRGIDPIERAPRAARRARLAEGPVSAEREAAIGWHLLRGGDLRSARLLARGPAPVRGTSTPTRSCRWRRARGLPRAGRQPGRAGAGCSTCCTAGFYSDRDVAVRYRDETLELLGRHAGIPSRRLRWLGLNLAFYVGVALATLWRGLLPPGRRGPAPVSAMRMWLRAVLYAAGVAGFSFDTEQLRRCVVRCLSRSRPHASQGHRRAASCPTCWRSTSIAYTPCTRGHSRS
ncbi:MAG: hypothetical protein U0168_19575 [Nannocystaceae bacterium]